MNKLVRFTLFAFSGFLLVLLIAILVLVMLIDPNDFKDEIAKTVHRKTGRSFTLDGDIHWRIFPSFGIKASGITLGNAPQFGPKPFAELGAAAIELRLSALLLGKISVGSVHLSNGDVWLQKDLEGQSNWESFEHAHQAKLSRAAPYVMVVSANRPEKTSPIALSISDLYLENINVHYTDMAQGKEMRFDSVDFHGSNIQFDYPFAVKGRLSVVNDTLSSPVHFKGDVSVSLAQSQYGLHDFSISSQTEFAHLPLHTYETLLQTTAEVDLKNSQIELSYLKGQLLGNPIDAQFILHHINGHPVANGYIRSPKFQWGTFSVSNIDTTIYTENSKIHVHPMTADIFDGRLDGHLIFENQDNAVRWRADGSLKEAALDEVSLAFFPLSIFSGKSDMGFTGHGPLPSWEDTMLHRQRATITVDAKEGTITGFNIEDFFKAAANAEKSTQTAGVTAFDTLTATIEVEGGRLVNDDLMMKGSSYTATGSGRVIFDPQDLLQSKVRYNFEANAPDLSKDLPLAIEASGTLKKVSIAPDLKAYLRALLKGQAKRGFFEQLGIGATLPPASSDEPMRSEEPDDGSDTPKSPRNPFEDILDKAGGIFK